MYKHTHDFVSTIVFGLAFAATASASTWVATGNLNTARWGHTATLLQNGKVLVVGGVANSDPFIVLDSVELYDPDAVHLERRRPPARNPPWSQRDALCPMDGCWLSGA
jgi:hypothetical protein